MKEETENNVVPFFAGYLERQIAKSTARIAVLLGVWIAVSLNQAWAIDITTCNFPINQPGDYHLTQDLTCPGNGIIILASGVNLDLGNHTLSGPGVPISTGVLVGQNPPGIAVSDVTIQGGTVRNFFFNILLSNTSDSKIVNVDASGGTNGIKLNSSNNDSVVNCIANNTVNAIQVSGEGNILVSNTANNSDLGIGFLPGSHNNAARANTTNNNRTGIEIFAGGTENVVQANRASGNTFLDLFDENANCDNNVWKSNKFDKRSQGCIQ